MLPVVALNIISTREWDSHGADECERFRRLVMKRIQSDWRLRERTKLRTEPADAEVSSLMIENSVEAITERTKSGRNQQCQLWPCSVSSDFLQADKDGRVGVCGELVMQVLESRREIRDRRRFCCGLITTHYYPG